MKRVIALCLSVLSLALYPAAMLAPQSNDSAARSLLLAISSEKNTYQTGEKIVIKANVKNVGDEPLMLRFESPMQLFFRFLIVRMSGVTSGVAALAEVGKEQLTPAHNIMAMVGNQLSPGMDVRDEIPVSEYYDMTASGSYRIVCFIQPEPFLSVKDRPRMTSKELVITVEQ
jgi:hypothetical protein